MGWALTAPELQNPAKRGDATPLQVLPVTGILGTGYGGLAERQKAEGTVWSQQRSHV